MAELGFSSADIASTIDELYKEYSEMLEMKEVKNLWNAKTLNFEYTQYQFVRNSVKS